MPSRPHKDSCMHAKEIAQMENEFNNEGINDLNNFVGDCPNVVNNINEIDQAAIERLNQPKVTSTTCLESWPVLWLHKMGNHVWCITDLDAI